MPPALRVAAAAPQRFCPSCAAGSTRVADNAAPPVREKFGEEGEIFERRRSGREQRFELIEPRFDRILACEPGGPFELSNERVKRAILMVRRTEIAQSRMRLAREPVVQHAHQTRLADAGLAASTAPPDPRRYRPLPPTQQQLDFLFAPDERRQGLAAQRLEAAHDTALT